VQTNSITVNFDWKPTSDTVAYFPLKWNYNEWSWKTVTTTISWTLSFARDSVLNLDYLNCSSAWWFYTSNLWTQWNITLSWWCKPNWNNAWMELFAVWYNTSTLTHIWWWISWWSNPWKWAFSFSSASTDKISSLTRTNEWHHFVITYNISTRAWTLFVDGVQLLSVTFSDWSISSNVLVIGWRYRNDFQEAWNWWVSRVIYEKRIWSATDILNYYNKTKKYYWK